MSVSARVPCPAALIPRGSNPARRRAPQPGRVLARRRVAVRTQPASDDGDASSAAYDAKRLEADASDMEAQRERMTDALDRQTADVDDDPSRDDPHGEWKWAVRKRIWDAMEKTNVAQFPRPVHHRIPNFVNADKAAANLASLPCFKNAQCVKVNPDTPQKAVRAAVLESGKTLMTPQPRLRTGFFSVLSKSLVPAMADDDKTLKKCCTSAGVASHGVPLDLDEMQSRKCDLLVIGSCAVDPKSGARLGKGEGFAELEYAIMRMTGTIDDDTLVVTTVHDTQVLSDGEIDTSRLLRHDVPVDLIVTPTRTIWTDETAKPPKPTGIYWDILSPQKLAQVKVLRDLRTRVEAERGEALPTGPDETLPPLAVRAEKKKMREAARGGRRGRGSGGRGRGSGGRGRGGGDRNGGRGVEAGPDAA